MSHYVFDLRKDAPVEIRYLNVNEIKRDANSPTGIMIRVGLGGGDTWWIPWHYHCDEDEIDADGWLALFVTGAFGTQSEVAVAWDTKNSLPLYAYTKGFRSGGDFGDLVLRRCECHGVRKVSLGYAWDWTLNRLRITLSLDENPFNNRLFYNKEWLAGEIGFGPAEGSQDLFWTPNCIRFDLDNPDIFAIGGWSKSDDSYRIAHFQIITNPPTTSPAHRGLYEVIDIVWLGTFEGPGIIVDFFHQGDLHKVLKYSAEGGYWYGNDTCRVGCEWPAYVFVGARVLSIDNCLFLVPNEDYPPIYYWSSLKGSPVDGWKATGLFNGNYYTYPVGVNSLLQKDPGTNSFCFKDLWYPYEPQYSRYGVNVSYGWWTDKNKHQKAFPINTGGFILNTADGEIGFCGGQMVRALSTAPISFKNIRPDGRFGILPTVAIDGWSIGAQMYDVYFWPYSALKNKL